MSKIGIYYFSGTGNTHKCAVAMREALLKAGAECDLHRIENGEEEFFGEEVLIFAYPVHGFGAPRNILDFARNLPDGNRKVYFMKTSGEPLRINDDSSASLRNILKKKGCVECGEYHYIMPYNMIFRHSDAMAAKMFLTARGRIEKDAQEIAAEKVNVKKIPLRAKIAYAVNVIERPGVRFNGLLFRVKKDQCISCGLCVKTCPMKNISLKDGKFRFGNNCILCARCNFTCPKNAIRIGLMDFMRVNGRYDFNADPAEAKIGRYCRKAYLRYFSEE